MIGLFDGRAPAGAMPPALLALALPTLALLTLAGAPPPAPILPGRQLSCTMHRVTNFVQDRDQSRADLALEGESALDLYIGPGPVRTGLPPEPDQPPEPTPPGTRVLRDTGGLLTGVPPTFSRVVDRWPQRVEIATDLPDDQFSLMILAPIDPVAGTATMLVTYVNMTLSYDPKRVWFGDCTIRQSPQP